MIKKIIASLEYLFVILSLILYTGGVLDISAIDGFSEGDGVYKTTISANEKLFVVKQILLYVTYIIPLILLMRMNDKSTKISVIFLRNIHVSLLVGLTVISAMWSELPSLTVSRSVALVGTTIFGIYLANRYTLKEQLILLRNTFLAIVLLSSRPLLGFGYGVFWENYGAIVSLAVAWDATHAHNGFLDLTLSVGLLGLALFSISYLSTLAKGLARFRSSKNDESIYPLIILIYIVISNVSETGLFREHPTFYSIERGKYFVLV